VALPPVGCWGVSVVAVPLGQRPLWAVQGLESVLPVPKESLGSHLLRALEPQWKLFPLVAV